VEFVGVDYHPADRNCCTKTDRTLPLMEAMKVLVCWVVQWPIDMAGIVSVGAYDYRRSYDEDCE
jgi:hypothetical protein